MSASAYVDWMKDPVQMMNVLGVFGQLASAFGSQNRLRNDPGLLALRRNMTRGANLATAYDPATGRFGAGNPYGDAASGYGGAFGHDAAGNPRSPFQANEAYRAGQLAGGQGLLESGLKNFSGVGTHTAPMSKTGGGAPPVMNFTMDPGGTLATYDPGAVQGVDQRARVAQAPEAIPLPEATGAGSRLRALLSGIKGSYETGTTNVPETGLYQLHAGEAVVPAPMNPNAGGPSTPMLSSGLLNPQTQRTAMPTLNTGNYTAMAPGLNPQAQQNIISRGTDTINRQSQTLMRDLRSQAGAAGRTGTAGYGRMLFDAGLERARGVSDLTRDVGLEAANRNFADTLAMNQELRARSGQENQEQLARAGLGLNAEQIRGDQAIASTRAAIEEFLGRQQNANTRLGLDQQYQLGLGQLGQQRYATDVNRQLEQARTGVTRELGLAGETTARRGQDVNRYLQELGINTDRYTTTRGQDINRALQEYANQTERDLGTFSNETTRLLGLRGADTADRGLDFNINSFLDQLGLASTGQQMDWTRYLLDRQDRLSQGGADSQAYGDQWTQQQMQDLMGVLSLFL